MSELALSINDFARRYLDPAMDRLWDMTRRELKRRRISRRSFQKMSTDEKWEIMEAASRRYSDSHTSQGWLRPSA